MEGTANTPSLLHLPTELIHHVLSYLQPLHLANAALTCRALRTLTYDDQIWLPIINRNLPHPIHTSTPLKSFRDLYVAHHPRWFIPKHRIWFGDCEPNGKLIVARYDQSRGCIEAYTVVAARGHHTLEFWEKDDDVIIHSFDPKISLNLHQPVLKLSVDSPLTDDQPNTYPSDRAYAPSSVYSKEVLMETFSDAGLYGSFMLCRNLPGAAIGERTRVWPPLQFPADARTRNDSSDGYNSIGHRPTSLAETSQETFRLRKWVEYTGRRSSPNLITSFASSLGALAGLGNGGMNVRFPEDITTYATLPPACYTPTKAKPWQGIWCGDYSGHGCEFLLITQPDKKEELPLPDTMGWLRRYFRAGQHRISTSDSAQGVNYTLTAEEVMAWLEMDRQEQDPDFDQDNKSESSSAEHGKDHDLDGQEREQERESSWAVAGTASTSHNDDNERTTQRDEFIDYKDVPSGRLEAIKLTGDPNIPRGEYTFIAPDIGHGGFLRVADEEVFRGARIVRSAGHIAGRGFRDQQYTPSQLIMISHDRLAQFWEGFGHISYYQRVNLDALTRPESQS